MNRDSLIEMHAETCLFARQLLARKNQAYGGVDIFGNLNFIETLFPGMTCEQGILLRMGDKLARLSNILSSTADETPDETVLDSLLDLINYCVLLRARRLTRTPIMACPKSGTPSQGWAPPPEVHSQPTPASPVPAFAEAFGTPPAPGSQSDPVVASPEPPAGP